MRNDDNTVVLVVRKTLQYVNYVAAVFCVEVACGLVGEYDAAACGKRARYCYALLLTARKH